MEWSMWRELLMHWNPRVERVGGARQSGALPYAIVDGRMAVLLVTSRKTGKWIFPKGAIEPDMTPWDSAAKEAVEEAGVLGTVGVESIGSYQAMAGADGAVPVEIDLYPLRVENQLQSWKEQGQRLRHWATVREARRLLADPALGRLATLLEAKLVRRVSRRNG
jgi:8-oxo-dGTP pyrophosphatase MutT (NUDIX family)